MSKLQTIFGLLLLLVVLFSMDMIFGNPIRESFMPKEEIVPLKMETGKLEEFPYFQGDDQPTFYGF